MGDEKNNTFSWEQQIEISPKLLREHD